MKITKLLSTLALLIAFTSFATAQDDVAAAKAYNDGLAKIKEDNYEEAMPLMMEAMENADSTSETGQKIIDLVTVNGSRAYYSWGTDLRKAGKLDLAVEKFQAGIDLNPDYSSNYLGIAQALEAKEDDVKAVKAYVKAGDIAAASENNKARAPKLYSKASNFAPIAYSKKNFEKAIACADAYLEAREGDGFEANYYKAAAMVQLEQFDDVALEHINLSIEQLPEEEDPDKYYFIKGEILRAQDKKDEAIAAFEMVKGEKYLKAAESRIAVLKQ